jgi:hypothetical protein
MRARTCRRLEEQTQEEKNREGGKKRQKKIRTGRGRGGSERTGRRWKEKAEE